MSKLRSLLFIGVLSCWQPKPSATPALHTEAPPQSKPTSLSLPPKPALVFLQLPKSSLPDAPWLGRRPTDLFPTKGEYRPVDVIAYGAKSALVESDVGIFAIHQEKGALGLLKLPSGWSWVGLDEDDAVYAATKEGALWRAESLTFYDKKLAHIAIFASR